MLVGSFWYGQSTFSNLQSAFKQTCSRRGKRYFTLMRTFKPSSIARSSAKNTCGFASHTVKPRLWRLTARKDNTSVRNSLASKRPSRRSIGSVSSGGSRWSIISKVISLGRWSVCGHSYFTVEVEQTAFKIETRATDRGRRC